MDFVEKKVEIFCCFPIIFRIPGTFVPLEASSMVMSTIAIITHVPTCNDRKVIASLYFR